MSRTEGCGYAGTIEGEEEGVEVVFEVVWSFPGPEHATGEMAGP
jgi:hypothetical protein